MKRIYKASISGLIIFVLLGSCRENTTTNVILNPIIQKFNSFPINSTGKVDYLDSAIFAVPEFMIYNDSILFFTFFYPKKHLIGSYLFESEEYIPIIQTGRGPNEGISAAGIGINRNNELWFYDNIQKNIAFIELEKLYDTTKTVNKESIPDEENYWNIDNLGDSIYLAFASEQQPEKKITMFNPYTNKLIKRVGDYHKTNGCPIEGVSEVFFASIKTKPEGDRFVCGYYRTDIIEIYNAKGDLIFSTQGPDCFDADYKIDEVLTKGVKFHSLSKEKIAYISINTTSQYIYGLYNYRYIHVFDWDGNPIKRLSLGNDIKEQTSSFCVDNKDKFLYFYSEKNGKMCRMEL